MEMFDHRAAKTVMQNVIFDCAYHFNTAREKFKRAGIERLDPARINQRDRKTLHLEFLGRLLCQFEHVAETENRDVAPMLHDLGFTDLERPGLRFGLGAGAGATRVTNGS